MELTKKNIMILVAIGAIITLSNFAFFWMGEVYSCGRADGVLLNHTCFSKKDVGICSNYRDGETEYYIVEAERKGMLDNAFNFS